MGNAKFSDNFKRDAEHQIAVWGYPVSEVSKRLGVSTHSLYVWVEKYSKSAEAAASDDHAAENRRWKRELAQVTEERDNLKKAQRTSPRMQNEAHFHPRASADIFYPHNVSMPTRSPQRIFRMAKEPVVPKSRIRQALRRSLRRRVERQWQSLRVAQTA